MTNAEPPKKKLLERVSEAIHLKHYSDRTAILFVASTYMKADCKQLWNERWYLPILRKKLVVILFAIVLRPTYCKMAMIFARCKNYWGIKMWRQRWFIPMYSIAAVEAWKAPEMSRYLSKKVFRIYPALHQWVIEASRGSSAPDRLSKFNWWHALS